MEIKSCTDLGLYLYTKVEAVAEGKENASAKVLMGDLYDMYYENRDLR